MTDPAVAAAASTIEQQLLKQLIGYFPFDDNYLDPLHGNIAAIANGSVTFTQAWDDRRAILIAADGEQLVFPPLRWLQNPNPDASPDFALSFWFNLSSLSAYRNLFTDPMGFTIIAFPNGDLQVGFGPSGTQVFPKLVTPGRWTHFTVSIRNPTHQPLAPVYLDFWLDGKHAGSLTRKDSGPAGTFVRCALGSSNIYATGVKVCGFAMFFGAISDDQAQYLACDLFHPETIHAASTEYLAARLDGQTSIGCPDMPELDFGKAGSDFSISAWVYTEELSYQMGRELILFDRAGAYRLSIDSNGQLSAKISGFGSAPIFSTDLPLDDFDWVHVVLSVDQHLLKADLYVNAKLGSTKPLHKPRSVPKADVTIGTNLANALYGVAVYDHALNEEEVDEEYYRDIPTEGLHEGCLVYYDLSASPPVALTRTGTTPLRTPPTLTYDVFSRAVSLSLDGYVHCGYDDDTIMKHAGDYLVIEAWIMIGDVTKTATILSRQLDQRGYRIFIEDGALAAEMRGVPGWQYALARSKVRLPAGEWIRIFACFANSPKGAFVRLYVNGRQVGEMVSSGGPMGPDPLVDPASPLLIGARFAEGPENAAAITDGFNGLVQRVTFYNGLFDVTSAIYAGGPTTQVLADWFFDADFPCDLTDGELASLRGAAVILTNVVSGSPTQVARLSAARADRARRHHTSLFRGTISGLWHGVPQGAPAEMLTTTELAGRVVAQVIDGRSYLVAHALAAGGTPAFLLVDDDPTTADWVELAIDVISLGLSVWGLKIGNTKAMAQTGLTMWRNPSVRAAITALVGIESAAAAPQLFIGLLTETYRQGFISRLLACYRLSFFAILRFAAMFAPWAAVALIAADLVRIGAKLYDLVRTRRKDAPSAVAAFCAKPPDLTGAVTVLVNGDPVAASVSVVPPPKKLVTVTAAPGPLLITPRTLQFGPSSGPQQVTATITAAIESKIMEQPVAVTWRGDGVVGEGVVLFRIRVLDLICEPLEPELTYDKATDAWIGEFSLEPTPELASGAVLEVDLQPEGNTSDDELTFDPPTLSFTTVGITQQPNATPKKKVKAKWKVKDANKKDKQFIALGKTNPGNKAGDKLRRSMRLKKKEQRETVSLTMVDARKGLCLVVKNRINDEADSYAVIDGGVSGTYANMRNYLPADGSGIALVACTHYDDDHIQGLIELLQARAADVQRVLFNPPPALSPDLASAPARDQQTTQSETAHEAAAELDALLHPLSVTQGRTLRQLAGTRLLFNITAMPPPNTSLQNVSQPTLDWKFGGPTPFNFSQMQFDPTNGKKVNLASLIFGLFNRFTNDGFSLLVTGDGTNKGMEPYVTGPAVLSSPIKFLQVPHHGSRHNSDQTLYFAVPAINYLISSRWSPHRHPKPEIIRAIVEANRLRGRVGYAIWITDPTFKKNGADDGDVSDDYDGMFPRLLVPFEYFVYRMNANQTGLTFVMDDGRLRSPPSSSYSKIEIAVK